MSARQRGRLIVRNVHFSATDADLADAFESFGPLRDCGVTRVRNSTKSRGFGFVEFESLRDAERALRDSSDGTLKVRGRDVAVDAAVSRDDYATPREDPESRPDRAALADGNIAMDDADADGASSDDRASGASDDDGDGDDDGVLEAAPVKAPRDVDEGRTLFVRNVPYGATRSELKAFFNEAAGPVTSVHLLKDRATGLHTGSCFVKLKGDAAATGAFDAGASMSLELL